MVYLCGLPQEDGEGQKPNLAMEWPNIPSNQPRCTVIVLIYLRISQDAQWLC